MTTSTISREMRDYLLELRDDPPTVRHAALVAGGAQLLTGRSAVEFFRASRDVFGSPYGLWQDDPTGFVVDVLGETAWSRQGDIYQCVESEPKVVVPSCFSSGKSHAAARLVVWWSMVWPVDSAVTVTTATRMRQVATQIWPHVAMLRDRHNLPGTVGTAQWRIPRNENDRTGALVAYGFTPPRGDPEAVQGVHKAHVLLIVDEGGGISVPIGEAWDSSQLGDHTRMVVFGNPPIDEEDGWLERISKSRQWTRVPIRAADTPAFTGEDPGRCRVCPDWRQREHNVITHLITRANVRGFIESHGRKSPFVISKVHAKFPRGGAPKMLPATWVDLARVTYDPLSGAPDRDLDAARGTDPRVDLGVDVAEAGGDKMVIARAEGLLARIVHTTSLEANVNNNTVAGYILTQIKEAETLSLALGGDLEQWPVRVKIDAIGVGWGVIGTLTAWADEGMHRALIIPVKGSEAAEDPARFANRRAEHWETTRELLQPPMDMQGNVTGDPPLALLVDRTIAGQMSMPKRETDSHGRIKLESSKSMRERGESSPDEATAITLAYYNPPSLMPKPKSLGLLGSY